MTMFWLIAPYLTIISLVVGTIWRYRYDRFGWTTRSSQFYEARILRIASPLFHFGILFVVFGHVVGLVIPESWTAAVGVTEPMYHWGALAIGGIAGVCTLAGMALLIYRRRTNRTVFSATTRNDKAMYLVLAAAILAGLVATFGSGGHNYRETVSVWFRSVFSLQPDAAAMAAAPLVFQLHTVIGMLLIAIFPFTRLIHAFAAPVGYLFRPYIVYRSREAAVPGTRRPRRGWERYPA